MTDYKQGDIVYLLQNADCATTPFRTARAAGAPVRVDAVLEGFAPFGAMLVLKTEDGKTEPFSAKYVSRDIPEFIRKRNEIEPGDYVLQHSGDYEIGIVKAVNQDPAFPYRYMVEFLRDGMRVEEPAKANALRVADVGRITEVHSRAKYLHGATVRLKPDTLAIKRAMIEARANGWNLKIAGVIPSIIHERCIYVLQAEDGTRETFDENNIVPISPTVADMAKLRKAVADAGVQFDRAESERLSYSGFLYLDTTLALPGVYRLTDKARQWFPRPTVTEAAERDAKAAAASWDAIHDRIRSDLYSPCWSVMPRYLRDSYAPYSIGVDWGVTAKERSVTPTPAEPNEERAAAPDELSETEQLEARIDALEDAAEPIIDALDDPDVSVQADDAPLWIRRAEGDYVKIETEFNDDGTEYLNVGHLRKFARTAQE